MKLKLIATSILISIVLFACSSSTNSHKLQTIKSIENPSKEGASLPRLFVKDSVLYMSWVAKTDNVSKLFYASYKNENWSSPILLNSGTDWFINWADFPAIAVQDDMVLTSYLKKSDTGTYTYDVLLNLYNEQTKSIKVGLPLHFDATKSEHGFVSVQPYSKSSFLVSWLDGRNTVTNHSTNSNSHAHDGHSGAMTLRVAEVDFQGNISRKMELDGRVCDCCNTAMTITDNGPIVVYRDRTEQEIRDIALVRLENEKWSTPKPVHSDHWKIAGCPVNGPSVSSLNETVAIAWFTAADEKPKVQLAFSTSYGEKILNPIRVDNGNAIGRVGVKLVSETEAAVIWMEPKGNETVVQFALVSLSGEILKTQSIAEISAERSSGFPQIEKIGRTLFFAWTEIEDETNSKSIKTAQISI